MTKDEIYKEIQKLAPSINSAISNLEETGYNTSSFAYKRVETLRFDSHAFINKKTGGFKVSTKLSKNQLERELEELQRLSRMKTLTVSGIQKMNEKAFKTFNKNYRETFNKSRGLTQKQFAQLKHDFGEYENSRLSELINSDTVVSLSKMSSKNLFKQLLDFADNPKHTDAQIVKEIKRVKEKYKID